MNIQLVKAAIVFGGSALVFWLIKPRTKVSAKKAPATDPATQKKNANIAMSAYLKAVKSGESGTSLEELNKIFESDYGLRVSMKQSEGKYYVSDLKGNVILRTA